MLTKKKCLNKCFIHKLNKKYFYIIKIYISCVVSDVNCRDLNTYCSAWAEQDQCRLNPKYMLQHCAFSCKACGL